MFPVHCDRPFPLATTGLLGPWLTPTFFLARVTSLYEAELALHNGDAAPRRAIWSRTEPVSVLGAWHNAFGQQKLDELFTSLEAQFSNCASNRFELLAHDVVGDMAYTADLEHISTSVDGEPRSFVGPHRSTAERTAASRGSHHHADTVAE